MFSITIFLFLNIIHSMSETYHTLYFENLVDDKIFKYTGIANSFVLNNDIFFNSYALVNLSQLRLFCFNNFEYNQDINDYILTKSRMLSYVKNNFHELNKDDHKWIDFFFVISHDVNILNEKAVTINTFLNFYLNPKEFISSKE